MSKTYHIILFSFFVLITACSGPEKEPETRTESNGVAEKAEENIEERRSKGDTLALSPDLLSKALPDEMNGYMRYGGIQKSQDTSTGSNWSSVSQTYSKGEKLIVVILSDYNGAYGLYAGATALFTSGMGTENEEEFSRPFQDGNVKGWESMNKKTKEASLIVARNDRFLITMEGEGQENLDMMKKFAKEINLNKIL